MNRSGLSLAEWLVRLEGFSPHEIVLGLERVHEVVGRLDPVLPRHLFIVGGTNGKGSSVALTAALLRATGADVGTYTSPHILRFNERLCINGIPLGDDDIIAAFERIESVRGDIPLTYFEFGTIAAILAFEARQLEVAVLEVGLGGRLDAVNAFEPTASLITSIALDHCAWLGNDVETIAVEKAGIMRAGKPTVFAAPEMPRAIRTVADALGAKLFVAGRDYHWTDDGDQWAWSSAALHLRGLARPGLAGRVQIDNAAGVLAMLAAAGYGSDLKVDTINRAWASMPLQGRMQSVHTDRHWILDVAHNPAAAAALAANLDELPVKGKTIALVAMLNDKDVEACVSKLSGSVDHWIAFRADSQRAIPVEELARRIANASGRPVLEAESMEQAMEYARDTSGADDRILVTGSFYSVGPALKVLELYSPR